MEHGIQTLWSRSYGRFILWKSAVPMFPWMKKRRYCYIKYGSFMVILSSLVIWEKYWIYDLPASKSRVEKMSNEKTHKTKSLDFSCWKYFLADCQLRVLEETKYQHAGFMSLLHQCMTLWPQTVCSPPNTISSRGRFWFLKRICRIRLSAPKIPIQNTHLWQFHPSACKYS